MYSELMGRKTLIPNTYDIFYFKLTDRNSLFIKVCIYLRAAGIRHSQDLGYISRALI